MTAFYILTKYLTFPGALVRVFWEQIVCRICGVPMEDTHALRRDEMCSHIEHELMPRSRGAFAVCFVPAFMNGILAFLLGVGPVLGLFAFQMTGLPGTIINIVAYWFACSLFVNSYPSVEDALNMRQKVYHEGTILQKIVYAPGFFFLFIGAYLERYGITFLIAVAGTILLIVKF